MSLGSLGTALLIPPVAFTSFAVAGLALSRARRWHRVGVRLTGACVLGTALLSLPVVSRLLLVSLETGLDRGSVLQPQAIVVLGGDTLDTTPPMLGPLSLERVRAGAALARRTGLPVLLTGGIVHPGEPSVAALMATTLRDAFGVTPRWVEGRSEDTLQNATLSVPVLRANGIDSIYLVTHAWHMRRGLIAMARAGMPAMAAPTALDPWPRLQPAEFLPSARAALDSAYALHEWLGLAYYRLL